MLKVEIVYVTLDQTLLQKELCLEQGASVADALNQSGLLKTHPEIKDLTIGMFSKRVSATYRLKSGDRLEIYRPLTLDPKEKRRQRMNEPK